jgi:hypothetical protein
MPVWQKAPTQCGEPFCCRCALRVAEAAQGEVKQHRNCLEEWTSVDKAKRTMQILVFGVLVLLGPIMVGDVVRGELSPWVWEELKNKHFAPSFAKQVFVVVSYLSFYSLGFFVPYLLITFVLYMGRQVPFSAKDPPAMPSNQRSGRLLLSLSTLVLFLLLLDSVIAFARALPTEAWNGWLLISGLATAAFFAYRAYLAFKRTKDRLSI